MKDPEHGPAGITLYLKKMSRKIIRRSSLSELTSLGLVQLTRKRTRESLEHILCETCPTCDGRATIKTAETICYEIFREILREVQTVRCKQTIGRCLTTRCRHAAR